MPRVANAKAKDFVDDRLPFRGSNTYGRRLFDGSYAAFSYGEHWPLYVWFRGSNQWFANAGAYSRSTSRHASQLRPRIGDIVPLPTTVLIALVEFCDGSVQATARWSRAVDRYEETEQTRRLVEEGIRRATDELNDKPAQNEPAWQPPGPRRLLSLG